MTNVSFDGSPVKLQLASPSVLSFDPVCLDGIRKLLASRPSNDPIYVGQLLQQINMQHPAMSCYQITDFAPGNYSLDPHDIRSFGNEELDLDYDEAQDGEAEGADESTGYLFVSVDSGALLFVDFACLAKFVELLSWEKYNLALQDDAVFASVTETLGGPFYALVFATSMNGMEFEGDGVYTVIPGALRPACH